MRLIVLFCLLLTACATETAERRQLKAEENRMEVEMDHNQCVSYGFPSGSQEYLNCRKRLKEQHNHLVTPSTMEDLPSDDKSLQKIQRQKQNPGKICTSKYCY